MIDEYKITKNVQKKEKNIHTHNSPAVPTYCINAAIIIMQKNIYSFNVTLAEFYRHDCRISESSLVSFDILALYISDYYYYYYYKYDA